MDRLLGEIEVLELVKTRYMYGGSLDQIQGTLVVDGGCKTKDEARANVPQIMEFLVASSEVTYNEADKLYRPGVVSGVAEPPIGEALIDQD